ncbi:MAG: HAMP domain-containing sensor histidine kinase [Planctomycetota bacterium]
MRVALRLTVLLALAACLVLTGYGLMTVRSEALMFERSMVEDARLNAHTLRTALQELARLRGPQAVAGVVESAGGEKLQFRYLPGVDGHYPGLDFHEAELRTLRDGHEVVRLERSRDPGLLLLYLPLRLDGGSDALLEVRESLEREEAFLAGNLRRIAGMTLGLIVILGALALLIGVRVVGHPLELLQAKAKRVGRGELDSPPVVLRQHDEIGRLATAMNDMCTQLAAELAQRQSAEQQLRHAERLATVGKLASGLAHELGTPLNVVVGRALEVEEDPECPTSSREAARIVVAQAERMSTIIRQLLDYARRGAPSDTRVELGEALQEVVFLLRTLARQQGVEVALELPEAPRWLVRGDPAQLQQAFTNLIMNGIQAMSAGGRLELGLDTVAATSPQGQERRCHVVRICDQGEGMSPETRAQIFEPFFTTKDAGVGTGLGLAVTHGIVSDHGGWIEVESTPGKGSCFSIYLQAEPAEEGPC